MDVGVSFEGLAFGAVASAFGLGLRHGFDWDHVAAITDITSSQGNTRRSLVFSTFYIAGHGVIVTGLGLAAIAAGSTIPGWLDGAMGRVIGATLVALGVYVIFALVRHGRDARMRSRWMLAIAGARRALRWIHRSRSASLVIEHDHEHSEHEEHEAPLAEMASQGTGGGAASPFGAARPVHRHAHLHVGSLPDDPFLEYGRATSFLVGMLHGIGAETPTQMLLFATAAGAATAWAGAVLLVAFVVGLMASNTVVAVASRAGALSAARNFAVYAAVSMAVAVFSLGLGVSYLLA